MSKVGKHPTMGLSTPNSQTADVDNTSFLQER